VRRVDMKLRGLMWACGLTTVMAVTAWAQNKDDYSVFFVKTYVQETTSSGVLLGSVQRQMWRQGDRVSIALLKIYSLEELRDARVVHRFLPAIQNAFEDLKWVESEQDRKPAVTLFLLTSIEREMQDPSVKKEVADLIGYVKVQTAGAVK
jgi:hypothetical protein